MSERRPWAMEHADLIAMMKKVGADRLAGEFGSRTVDVWNAALERHGRHFPAKWLAFLIANSGSLGMEYLRGLAAERGLELVPISPAAEELADLKTALAECLGPEMHQVVLGKVRRSR